MGNSSSTNVQTNVEATLITAEDEQYTKQEQDVQQKRINQLGMHCASQKQQSRINSFVNFMSKPFMIDSERVIIDEMLKNFVSMMMPELLPSFSEAGNNKVFLLTLTHAEIEELEEFRVAVFSTNENFNRVRKIILDSKNGAVPEFTYNGEAIIIPKHLGEFLP